ncbi:hypothetical protein HYW87_03390 [Candidatus Roizmanbacteria bacterium]|nr:hypothetical protein [Candidatus Roizmanbacteria bacterium]
MDKTYFSSVNGMQLYKFKEYPVQVGNPESSAALCIVWQSLENVIRYYPEFIKQFAIIGNLRSSFGTNIIIYNLALNPHITKLFVWGPDKLSNTDIGVFGKNTLLSIWKDNSNEVAIAEEIDRKVFATIRANVQLEDLSSEKKLDVKGIPAKTKPYMGQTFFPEIKVKTPETFPSENYTYPIRVKKGADGYLSLLYHINKYGKVGKIDQAEEDVKEIRGAVVVIENEDPANIFLPEWLTKTKELNTSANSLENYYKTQFSPDVYKKEIFPGVSIFERPRDYSYLYAEQIFAYPRPKEIDDAVFTLLKKKGYKTTIQYLSRHSRLSKKKTREFIRLVSRVRGKKKKIAILLEALIPRVDQVANVIERIKRKKDDLDKEIVLWDTRYHSRLESGRPCIMKISFIVRDEKIDLHVFARSHDIASAWFYNFYGVTRLLGKVAAETNYKPGFIIIESESAHIYKRDWEKVNKLVKKYVEDAQPRMFFDPVLDSDPRGIVNVEVYENSIKLKLQDLKTGTILHELTGRSARELIYKLKHYGFISRVDHGMFIGGELAKAELCMKLKIPYRYDNPIKLPGGEQITS